MPTGKKEEDNTIIPSWEWGEGSRVDWENNTLYGVSGVVYRNIVFDEKEFMKFLENTRKRETH